MSRLAPGAVVKAIAAPDPPEERQGSRSSAPASAAFWVVGVLWLSTIVAAAFLTTPAQASDGPVGVH